MAGAPRRRNLRITKGDASVRLLGSDLQTLGMVGRCRLCRLVKRLLLSHIAPRWAFTWMKQEGGVYGSYQSHGIEYVEQDGRKHYLLCAACEQLLGRAENYLAHLCRGRPADRAAMGVELTTPPGLSHLDINRVLIALVGTALRVHLAPSPPSICPNGCSTGSAARCWPRS